MAIKIHPASVWFLPDRFPVKFRVKKRRFTVWIRNSLLRFWRTELTEFRELAAAPFCDFGREFRSKVTKELKRSRSRKLFAHEQQRRRRCKQQYCHRHPDELRISNLGDALAKSPISDLVMVLKERNEAIQRKAIARFSSLCTLAKRRALALEAESLRKTLSQMLQRILGILRVISIFFPAY